MLRPREAQGKATTRALAWVAHPRDDDYRSYTPGDLAECAACIHGPSLDGFRRGRQARAGV